MPAQSRLQRTGRHLEISPAAPAKSGRPVSAAEHGRRRGPAAARPRTERTARHLRRLRRGRRHVHRVAPAKCCARSAGRWIFICPIAWTKATASAADGVENCLRKLRFRKFRREGSADFCWPWTAARPRSTPFARCANAAWTSSFSIITRFPIPRPPPSRW